MKSRDISTEYLFELYRRGFNAQSGDKATKHLAGLLEVVEGTQPGVNYPRAPKEKDPST